MKIFSFQFEIFSFQFRTFQFLKPFRPPHPAPGPSAPPPIGFALEELGGLAAVDDAQEVALNVPGQSPGGGDQNTPQAVDDTQEQQQPNGGAAASVYRTDARPGSSTDAAPDSAAPATAPATAPVPTNASSILKGSDPTRRPRGF